MGYGLNSAFVRIVRFVQIHHRLRWLLRFGLGKRCDRSAHCVDRRLLLAHANALEQPAAQHHRDEPELLQQYQQQRQQTSLGRHLAGDQRSQAVCGYGIQIRIELGIALARVELGYSQHGRYAGLDFCQLIHIGDEI